MGCSRGAHCPNVDSRLGDPEEFFDALQAHPLPADPVGSWETGVSSRGGHSGAGEAPEELWERVRPFLGSLDTREAAKRRD